MGTWERDEKEDNKKLYCFLWLTLGLLLEGIYHHPKWYCSVNRGQRFKTLRPGNLGKSKGWIGLSTSWLMVICTSVTNGINKFKKEWLAVKSLMPLGNP